VIEGGSPVVGGFTLALGGGGALGLAHLGVLSAFEERGLHPVAVSGTSIGAIVAGMYALGCMEEGEKALKECWPADLWLAGLSRGNSYRKRLRDLFGEATIGDCGIPLITCAAPARDKTKPVYLERPALAVWEAVSASTALPIIMAPARVNGRAYIDGGAADNMPTAPLRKFGRPVVGVELGFLRGALRHDERPRGFWLRIKHKTALVARYRDLPDHILKPRVRGYGPMSFHAYKTLREAGRRCAVEFLEGRKQQKTAF
jgi:NTE family protein